MDWKQTKVKGKDQWKSDKGGYKITKGERFKPGSAMTKRMDVFHCYDKDGKYIAQDYDVKEAKLKCSKHKIAADVG